MSLTFEIHATSDVFLRRSRRRRFVCHGRHAAGRAALWTWPDEVQDDPERPASSPGWGRDPSNRRATRCVGRADDPRLPALLGRVRVLIAEHDPGVASALVERVRAHAHEVVGPFADGAVALASALVDPAD